MDNRNDDSGGSDSLDKSLQKKCVVQDSPTDEESTVDKREYVTEKFKDSDPMEPLQHTAKKQKTEHILGSESVSEVVSSSSSISTAAGTLLNKIAIGGEIPNMQQMQNKKTFDIENNEDESTLTATNSTLAMVEALPIITPSSSGSTSILSTGTTHTSNICKHAFDSKVKQIAKNLKETTLTDNVNKKASLEDSSSSSSTSSSSSDCDTVTPPCSSQGDTSASNTSQAPDSEATLPAPTGEQDHRSKKVRFHPDAKENDGGNRIIPKKKKKIKMPTTCDEDDDVTLTPRFQKRNLINLDEEMECDEEEEYEEEQFDLAKTIAEAQDYLRTHPLTFVRPSDEPEEGLTNGVSDDHGSPQVSDSSEDENCMDDLQPENNVQRILGKHMKNGKVEFLCRFVEKPGLFWETEESLARQCPNMLNKYERSREKRQARLMRHVAKRQNARQRYTDF